MSLMPMEEAPRLEEMSKVVELYIQNVNPTKIARELGIRRVDVLAHIEDFKKSAVGTEVMKERVEELVATMDSHYSILIRKAYEVIEEVDKPEDEDADGKRKETMTRSQMLSQKMNAIKTIADLEAKRIDMLQKSGLLEAADMGDQLVEMEEQYERVMNVLEEHLCANCLPKIMGALAQESGSTVIVHGE